MVGGGFSNKSDMDWTDTGFEAPCSTITLLVVVIIYVMPPPGNTSCVAVAGFFQVISSNTPHRKEQCDCCRWCVPYSTNAVQHGSLHLPGRLMSYQPYRSVSPPEGMEAVYETEVVMPRSRMLIALSRRIRYCAALHRQMLLEDRSNPETRLGRGLRGPDLDRSERCGTPSPVPRPRARRSRGEKGSAVLHVSLRPVMIAKESLPIELPKTDPCRADHR